jgi:glycosyltransferase involved in cell wall biosynthesis
MEFLHNNGFDVTFICSDKGDIKEDFPEYFKIFEIPMKRGIEFIGVFIAIYRFYKHFRKNKYDIVAYSGPNASLYASVASKFSNIPVRIYSQWGIRYVGFNGIMRVILKFLEKITCYCSSVIQPDSRGNLDFAVSEGLYPISKGQVIWNGSAKGIDFEVFDIEKKQLWRDEIRKKLSINERDIVIGYVGALRADKGTTELFGAFKELLSERENIKLLLVGDRDLYSTIDSRLGEWALNNNNVIFCGNTQEVNKYYAAMDIYAFPSYREGFGMTIIEAGAMELPIITTDIPGPKDWMINGKTGILIEPKSQDALKEALDRMLNEPEIRMEMGRNARLVVKQKFDKNILMKKYLENKLDLIKKVDMHV